VLLLAQLQGYTRTLNGTRINLDLLNWYVELILLN